MKSSGASYNQIMIFHSIAREGSIRGAARQLEMAAPSVSQSLKRLESKLGLPLFSRSTRQMNLTEAGRFLLENTKEAMTTLDCALEGVRDLRRAPSGKVSMTIPRFVYQSMIQPVFADFCRLYPDIELEISVSEALVNISQEGIDVGIRFGDLIEEGLVARKLTGPVQESFFASPAYLEKYGTPQSPEDLENHKLIQYRFGASNRLAPTRMKQAGSTVTVDIPGAMIVNDTDIIIDGAVAGIGIGRFLTPLMAKYFEQGVLVPILQPYWFEYPGLYLCFQQNSQKAKRIRVLIDFLLEHAQLRAL
ncbi:HTH-type transcriptional regulator DmlR [Vibrio aerogenes CECT 7868]|uniref:HTH-type transcriptional regulator DmlR n=1 Tax=Vibrio aerogenes CECT 7868 TaxID=1216006 RepID=A0A1M5UMM3_9VIBR|nr:LysR family transcriptional regulator [Vibrio aerogenes]SHH63963.1 HTH-type transcriptional regulator DmlR [Vibrio aerogenes CECT 7868]